MPSIHRNPQRRSGHTLVELVVALAVASLILLATGSAVVLATKALPGPDEAITAAYDSYDGALTFVTEVRYAKSFVEVKETTITFTVADRDGDDVDEVVQYAWGGNRGDPVLRQENGGAAEPIIPSAMSFKFVYALETVSREVPGPETTSAEQLISSIDSTKPVTQILTADQGKGQFVKPTPPSGTTAWRGTRLYLHLKAEKTVDGVSSIQLRPCASTGAPDATIMAQQDLQESSAPDAAGWVEVSLAWPEVDPDLPVTIAIVGKSGTNELIAVSSNGTTDGQFQTGDAGANWSDDGTTGLMHQLYGVYISAGPTVTETKHYLQSVTMLYQDDAGVEQRWLRAPVLNRVEVVAD